MRDIIAGYRRMTGMRQEDFAKKMNISRQSYWNKETGRTPFTDEEKMIFVKEVSKVVPDINVMDIFFSQKVGK